MRKSLIIIMSLILTVLMSVSIFAANFKDVPKDEWYTQYVNKAANAGIIKGYDDNTFRPKGQIAFTEISSLLGNLVNVTESEMQEANSTFGKELDAQLKIVKKQGNKGIDWARPVILKCLKAGVYDMTTLEGAVKAKMLLDTDVRKRPPVSRSNTAAFFADALKVNVTAASLTYKDTSAIPANIQTKVQALIDAGILSKDGDGNGYFKPTSPIDRASIAKMITIAMDYIAKNPTNTNTNTNTNTTTTVIPQTNTLKTFKGKVTAITDQGQQSIVLINNGSDAQAVYVNYTTVVNIDGQLSLFGKIKEGMTAEVTFNSANGVATKGDFKSEQKVIEGKISSVISTYRFEIQYTQGSIVNNTIELDLKDANITVDGSSANVSDLDKGFDVKITMLGDTATKVEAKRGNAYSDGTFISFNYYNSTSRDRGYYLDLYPNNSRSRKSVKIDDDYIRIDGTKVKTSDLTGYNAKNYIAEGTPIKLTFNSYNEVTDISTVFGNIKDGIIQGYIYTDPRRSDNYITVSPKKRSDSYSRDTIDLRIDSRTDIYIDGRSTSYIDDLDEDDYVRITMRNGYVDKIEVDRRGNRWGYSSKGYATGTLALTSRNSDFAISVDYSQSDNLSKSLTVFKRDPSGVKYRVDNKNESSSDTYFWNAYNVDGYRNVRFEWYKSGSTYYITAIDIRYN